MIVVTCRVTFRLTAPKLDPCTTPRSERKYMAKRNGDCWPKAIRHFYFAMKFPFGNHVQIMTSSPNRKLKNKFQVKSRSYWRTNILQVHVYGFIRWLHILWLPSCTTSVVWCISDIVTKQCNVCACASIFSSFILIASCYAWMCHHI